MERSCGVEAVAVAVRSSAVGEDGEELSYAGQYESRLNVTGAGDLIRAVRDCLAGQESERARSYREAAAAKPSGMALLVQRMVAAEYAGVCFTQSPLSSEEVVVEAIAGLGESLVSGVRSPARVCFARAGLEPRSTEDPEGILARLKPGSGFP
jgi:pyruvate,water dikinase